MTETMTDSWKSEDTTAALQMMNTRHMHCITREDSAEQAKIKDLSAQSMRRLPSHTQKHCHLSASTNSGAQPDVDEAEDEDDTAESDTCPGRDEWLCGRTQPRTGVDTVPKETELVMLQLGRSRWKVMPG